MPLPPETLEEIKERIKSAKERLADLKGTLADLRASGVDASKQDEQVRALEADLKKWEMFYGLQTRKLEQPE